MIGEPIDSTHTGASLEGISFIHAVTGMPRASPDAWLSSSLLIRWLIAARASVLVMTFASVALGGLLALKSPGWDPLAWLGCLAGLLLFYTWPLKQWGLGEPAVLLTWGSLMVGGSHLAASGDWQWSVCLDRCLFCAGADHGHRRQTHRQVTLRS
jgi:hypothetical protein